MTTVQSDVGRQGTIVVVAVVLAACAVGYVAVTYFADGNRKQSSIAAVRTEGRGTSTPESSHYADVLSKYNQQNAAAAEQSGKTYLSVLSSQTNPVPATPAPSQSQPQPSAQPQAAYYAPQAPQASQQDAQREKEVGDQIKGMMENWAPVPGGVARVSADGDAYEKSLVQVSTGHDAQQPSAAKAGDVKVVEDFALVPATLETDIDTDENSVVRANVPVGQYAGAELYAMGYKRLDNTVDMTFTYMQWRGHSYKVTAKALDQHSMRTALSGEVNHRYFTRIILPAIATGIGQAGQLFAQASAQNIITPQGGVIQTYPSTPSARALGGTIAGGIAAQTGQVLSNEASTVPQKQVLIGKGTTIGIQFIGPVLASADLALGATNGAEPQGQNNYGVDAVSQPAPQPPRGQFVPPPAGYNTPNVPGYTPPTYYQPYQQNGNAMYQRY